MIMKTNINPNFVKLCLLRDMLLDASCINDYIVSTITFELHSYIQRSDSMDDRWTPYKESFLVKEPKIAFYSSYVKLQFFVKTSYKNYNDNVYY